MGTRLSIMLLWTMSSPQLNSIVVRVRYGQVFASYILWYRALRASTALSEHRDRV